jgi:hypothetical protein
MRIRLDIENENSTGISETLSIKRLSEYGSVLLFSYPV